VDAGDECPEETKSVYVISEEKDLYLFHPVSLEFIKLGPLSCPTTAAPSSMAIDRHGTAWVRYSDGRIWRIDTKTLACSSTGYVPNESMAFFKFGMGFVSVAKGSSEEQLFLSDNQADRSAGLGHFDTTALKTYFIGPYTGDLVGKPCELAGTGDGRLFGFFVTNPAQVAEIEKRTGAILSSKSLPFVTGSDAWAFSFYAGDFYIYTMAEGALTGSDVTRYRPDDGSFAVVKSGIGVRIVGAGTSTCAPYEGPR
jgi:hypothetical protein